MSTSYPYLTLARERNLNYGDVLGAAVEIERNGCVELQGPYYRRFSFYDLVAIREAVENEQQRRRE